MKRRAKEFIAGGCGAAAYLATANRVGADPRLLGAAAALGGSWFARRGSGLVPAVALGVAGAGLGKLLETSSVVRSILGSPV